MCLRIVWLCETSKYNAVGNGPRASDIAAEIDRLDQGAAVGGVVNAMSQDSLLSLLPHRTVLRRSGERFLLATHVITTRCSCVSRPPGKLPERQTLITGIHRYMETDVQAVGMP